MCACDAGGDSPERNRFFSQQQARLTQLLQLTHKMAQVESNSDPKFSKGGGSAKKSSGKPSRDSLDAMIKQLKALVPNTLQEDSLERVLEKNNYDINNSVDYIYAGVIA